MNFSYSFQMVCCEIIVHDHLLSNWIWIVLPVLSRRQHQSAGINNRMEDEEISGITVMYLWDLVPTDVCGAR